MIIRELAAVVVVTLLTVVIAAYRLHHDANMWDPDAAIYLRMTLQHRGMSESAAKKAAVQLIQRSPVKQDPRLKNLIGPHPPQFYVDQFALFRGRQLYPTLGAVIYPRFGSFGLRLISALAYVGVVLIMYALLRRFVSIPIAAVGALGFGTAPAVLSGIGLVTTDELGLLFWVASLGALFAYLRKPHLAWLIVLAVTAFALSLTRPAIYLPLGAAIAAFMTTRRSAERRAATTALLIMLAVTLAYFSYGYLVHAVGPVAQLRWEYAWYQTMRAPFTTHGFLAWWVPSVAVAAVLETILDVYKNGALLIIVLAFFGAAAAWRSLEMSVMLGGAIAAFAAILVNPTDVERTITLPITPVAVILATIALQRLADLRMPLKDRQT